MNLRNYTHIAIRYLLPATIGLLCCCTVSARISDSLRQELSKVSAQLLQEKNNNFIIVDALLDNLVKLNSGYKAAYKDGMLHINDKELPAALKEKYLGKIQSVCSSGISSFSMSAMSLTLKEIFDPTSNFRTPFQLGTMQKPDIERPLTQMLVKDGVVDTTKDYSILYCQAGLFVNNKLLPADKSLKYIRFINMSGFIPKMPTDNLKFNRIVMH